MFNTAQSSQYLLVLSNNRGSHQRLVLQNGSKNILDGSFDNLSKVLEEICDLQDTTLLKTNSFTDIFEDFAKILVTLSDISKTPI